MITEEDINNCFLNIPFKNIIDNNEPSNNRDGSPDAK